MEKGRSFVMPSDFDGCFVLEKSAKEWRKWSVRVKLAGKVLAVLMIAWGIVYGVDGYLQGGESVPLDVLDNILAIGSWGIIGAILLVLGCALSLLLQVLAGISKNLEVVTKIIAFQSAVDGYPDSRLEDHYISKFTNK